MDIEKRTLRTTEQSVLEIDVLDIQDWVIKALNVKIAACKNRMLAQWLPIIYADDSVTSIPANEDDLIALIVARDDYKTRKESESNL